MTSLTVNSPDVTKPVLEIRSLFKRFDESGWVVEDASLIVEQGELLYVLGPSGSGKTTLLRLICGFETPDGGEILQGGRVISRSGWALPPERRRIGMVFQDYAIFPHLTVGGNVAFGLTHPFYQRALNWLGGVLDKSRRGPPAPAAEQVTRRLAEMFALTGLEGLESRFPHELSGGQRQRVAIGRAIVRDARLFLFDEPLSNLDAQLRDEMRSEIKRLHQELGKTMVYVTHDQIEAMTLADRIVLLRDGRIEQQGAPLELFERPTSRFVAGFLGSPAMNFVPGSLVALGDTIAVRFDEHTRLELPPARRAGPWRCGA